MRAPEGPRGSQDAVLKSFYVPVVISGLPRITWWQEWILHPILRQWWRVRYWREG